MGLGQKGPLQPPRMMDVGDLMSAKNSLERVISVLEVFTENKLVWTPEELMAELGYSRPTLYRYLKTLRDAGLLASSPGAGFTLGPKVVEMDFLVRKSDLMVLNGPEYLKSLTVQYPCTAFLVRWYGDKILCVASEMSTKHLLSSYPRGRPMSLERGAISRSIMAFLPKRRLLPLVDEKFDAFQEIGLGETRSDILASFKKIRKRGVVIAHGEITPGAAGIAAPVFNGSKSPVGSLCLTFETDDLAGFDNEAVCEDVRETAGRISSMLTTDLSAAQA